MKTLLIAFAGALLTCAIVSADDDPLVTASDNLQAAVNAKKSAAEIKTLAVAVMTEAKKQMGPAPADADKATWEDHAKYAQGVSEYAEYALYAASATAPVATAADLVTTLETESPKSKYLTQDTYLAVANAAMTAQQTDRAVMFAKKSLTAAKGTQPEAQTARAHWIIGVIAANKNDYSTADKELRAALPGVKGTPALEGPADYFLGEADYNLGRKLMDRAEMEEGVKYVLQSAQIPGQYQSMSVTEARRMKTEAGIK